MSYETKIRIWGPPARTATAALNEVRALVGGKEANLFSFDRRLLDDSEREGPEGDVDVILSTGAGYGTGREELHANLVRRIGVRMLALCGGINAYDPQLDRWSTWPPACEVASERARVVNDITRALAGVGALFDVGSDSLRRQAEKVAAELLDGKETGRQPI